MYVCLKNGYLLRNFFFAFVIASFVSLAVPITGHARVVDLTDYNVVPGAGWANGYVWVPFSTDGEEFEYNSVNNNYTYGYWSELNSATELNSQISGNKTYDVLQVFEIYDTTNLPNRRFRIVLLSALGERYSQYFQRYFVRDTDRMWCMFKANLDRGDIQDAQPGQLFMNQYTAPWALFQYENDGTAIRYNGWLINVITPYTFDGTGETVISNPGILWHANFPGYATPNNFGELNGIGWVIPPSGNDGLHIKVIYSEDYSFWTKQSVYDPDFEIGNDVNQEEVLNTYLSDLTSGVADINANTAFNNTLQQTANTILSGISQSAGSIYSGIQSLYDLTDDFYNDLMGETSYIDGQINSFSNRNHSDLNSINQLITSASNTQLQFKNQVHTDIVNLANSTYSELNDLNEQTSINGVFLEAMYGDIASLSSDVGTGFSATTNALNSMNTNINSLRSELGGFGVGVQGNGTTTIAGSISSTKTQFENAINTHEPFNTINAAYTWVQSTSNWSQINSYYVDLPIPYAGNVRFDLGMVFNRTFGGISIGVLIQYCITIPLMIALLYASYRLLLGTFGGKS